MKDKAKQKLLKRSRKRQPTIGDRYSPEKLSDHREGASRRWDPMVKDLDESGKPHPEWTSKMRRPIIEEIWSNRWYYACVVRLDEYLMFEGLKCPLVYIGLSSIDEMARHDWRDMQSVKNDIAGPEWEAVELFPAESRLVDPSNRYYLWCIPKGIIRFGFNFRRVWDSAQAKAPQRPFPKGVLTAQGGG